MASSEVALWRAVISQSIADACGIVRSKNPAAYRDAIRIRDEARSWLLNNTKDFRDVCEMTLLEPDAVREMAQGLSRKGWIARKPERIADTLAA